MGMQPLKLVAALMLCLWAQFVGAAQTKPQAISPLFATNPTSSADLAVQTRRLHTDDSLRVLDAASALLQDMGYTVSDGSRVIGTISARRAADVEGAGIGHAVVEAVVVLIGLVGGEALNLPEQVSQVIYISVLVDPDAASPGWTRVRISIDRDMIYDSGQVIPDHTELPLIYAEFFEKLARALFLEAQDL